MRNQSIGNFLASLRREKGLTQQEVADRLGISNRTLSAWETDKSYPDILLLPALADIYGVTADEIVRGERKPQPEQPPKPSPQEPSELSEQSLRRVLKNRHARFVTQACILTSILLASVVVIFFGVLVGFTAGIILCILGFVAFVIGAGLLIAFTISAWNAKEGETQIAGQYRLLVAHTIFICYSVIALCLFVLGLSLFFLTVSYGEGATIVVSIGILIGAVSFFLGGELTNVTAINHYGSEEQKQTKRRNDKLYAFVTRFGAIPFCVALICTVVCWVWQPQNRNVLYSGDAEGLVSYAETLVVKEDSYLCAERGVPAGEYPLDLSGRLARGEHAESGDIILLEIPLDKATLHAKIIEGDEFLYLFLVVGNGGESPMCETQIAAVDGVTFYPVRTAQFLNEFQNDTPTYTENIFYEKHDLYEYNAKDGVYLCEYVTDYDIRGLGVIAGGLILLVELVVCAAVCIAKREKIKQAL